MTCAGLASYLTVVWGPGANGSGVAEIMGILNGVNYKGAIGIATLFVKIIGVILAVVGNLCVGKEGPLAHIGAIIGVTICYLPFEKFKIFQNDSDKRTFISAGCSAGVSAAFGSPIGGALFTYEISKPNTFWTFGMLWRVFFSSAISTLTLGFFSSLQAGTPITLSSAAVLKFGDLQQVDSPVTDLFIALILGIVSGCLGAGFIDVNSRLGILRKKYIDTKVKKICETMLFSFITASLFFWISASAPTCLVNDTEGGFDEYYRFNCPEGTYNPTATLFFNTEGGTIRALMNSEVDDNIRGLILFVAVWYLMTITTYGVWVPSGLFLPGMIIGCGLGLLVKDIWDRIATDPNPLIGQSYMIMGASAMLAGYTRLTYSLAVIMLETT
jgi:chloride channel 7